MESGMIELEPHQKNVIPSEDFIVAVKHISILIRLKIVNIIASFLLMTLGFIFYAPQKVQNDAFFPGIMASCFILNIFNLIAMFHQRTSKHCILSDVIFYTIVAFVTAIIGLVYFFVTFNVQIELERKYTGLENYKGRMAAGLLGLCQAILCGIIALLINYWKNEGPNHALITHISKDQVLSATFQASCPQIVHCCQCTS